MNTLKKQVSALVVLVILCMPAYAMAQTTSLFPEATGMYATVNGTNVNIRNYPDKKANVIGKTDETKVKVIGKTDDWYQVICDGQKGWIYADYLVVPRDDFIPYVGVQGEQIIGYGLEFIGTPYVWGGTDLDEGVDCSGFTQEVYGAFDVNISRVSYMQAEDGITVSKSNLECGDLVFFDTQGVNDGNVSHVGIYMGEDRFLHSDGTHGVMVSDLNSAYYTRNYVKGVRVL